MLHVHPVLGVRTPADRHAAQLYARYLSEFAPHYGFGFTERKLASRSGKRVAAYLSSYFVTGKKGKLSLQESVMAADMPRSIIHVSTELTQKTGVTMRELRFRRFVWFIASKSNIFQSDMRIAREVALAWREHGGVPPREVQRTIIRKYETDDSEAEPTAEPGSA